MGKGWLIRSLAIVFLLVFVCCYADAAPPQVIATNPPNGAVGVRPDIDTIQILLDKPITMENISPTSNCITLSDNWPATVVSVIGFDGLLYHFERMTRGTDLPLGSQVRLTLNPPGAGSNCFRDEEGTLLPTYELSFTVRQNPEDPPIEPQVVSADPPMGATGVDPNISSVSITFSKPMAESTDSRLGAWFFSYAWGPGVRSWSPDGRTLNYTRADAATPLPAGQTVIFILNWELSMRLQDTDGNVLPEYSYYFTTEGDSKAFWENYSNVTITKIPENPSKGFYWPYYLSIPNSLQDPSVLFVEPNNSGYPALDHVFHDAKAAELLYHRTARVNATWGLHVPILVPTFPRSYGIYTQSGNLWLPHDCNCPELERADLQLIAMIDDAKERLRSMGHIIGNKVFMNGFSASCGFTGMFTIIHPELTKAAACGGGLPDEYDPQRISTLEALIGSPIDLQSYFNVPLYLYMGDQDSNYDADLWLLTRQFYESAGARTQLVLYPGVGHTITEQMWSDLKNWFYRHNTLFSDISTTDYWAYDYILAIYNAHITTGYGDGRYGPEDDVTREQMAAFIVRAKEGEPAANYCDSGTAFPDVTPDMWSCKYIKKLKELGITTGYQDGTYGPYDLVPREQMAAFIIRAVEGEPPANYCDSGSLFPDVTPDMWSCRYIKRLKELGITTGYGDGRYGPYDPVTRAQMAAFLARAFLGMQ
jgi:predicted esterase